MSTTSEQSKRWPRAPRPGDIIEDIEGGQSTVTRVEGNIAYRAFLSTAERERENKYPGDGFQDMPICIWRFHDRDNNRFHLVTRPEESNLGQALETLAWSSCNEHGESFDAIEADWSPEARASLNADLVDFEAQLANYEERNLMVEYLALDDTSYDQLAHDFILTRNRHGAGFWDRGLPGDLGDLLTDIAHTYGSVDVYHSISTDSLEIA